MTDTEIYGCDYSSTGSRLGTYPNIDSEYGSEIHLVQGEKRNDKHINELEIYIQNCMLEEPRVYEVTDLNITEVEHDALRIDLLLLLVDGSELGFTEEINTYG